MNYQQKNNIIADFVDKNKKKLHQGSFYYIVTFVYLTII